MRVQLAYVRVGVVLVVSGALLIASASVASSPEPARLPSAPPTAPVNPDAKALGRVERPAGVPNPNEGKSFCELAEAARMRNSPTAPDLEAQCQASKPAIALGRVSSAPSLGPPVSICDAAISARLGNRPTAGALEAQCRAIGGGAALDRAFPTLSPDELASKGEAIAATDSQLATLRGLQPEGGNRRGFDIGVAACGEDTAWGPGKQKLLDSLALAEQEGFRIAASFVLDRNRNAKLAAAGLVIDNADPVLARARIAEADVRYGLGFDIATGLFGDPALGSQGSTTTGPGSLGIRDALSRPAQRGFDAATKLHFSRHY